MINNDLTNRLNQFFNNRAGKNENNNAAADVYKKLKEKQEAMTTAAKEKEAESAKAAQSLDTVSLFGRPKKKAGKAEADAKADAGDDAKTGTDKKQSDAEAKLTPEERRQKELQAILDKLNKEGGLANQQDAKKAEETAAAADAVLSPDTDPKTKGKFLDFLNDMPLFNEFKSGLIDAFRSLDSASAGSISAQYELNYTTMQAIANSAGGYDYKEVSLNIKLDLNYVKAAGGLGAGDIADKLAKATDVDSFLAALSGAQNAGGAKGTAPKTDPKDFMATLQDYWSPEKTAGRIVDFATAFFPMSDSFKAKGDTEEAREEFAKTMRDAIQKGFDQAMGALGKVPKATQEGIDKTHELTFNGIDDFVKNGANKKKEEEGVYNQLQNLLFSAQVSYSEKSVSVRSGTYNQARDTSSTPAAQALDTQA